MSRVGNKVPPDGGYGWVVTFAYGLNNVVVLPLLTNFGIIFQEAFADVGLSHTQSTLVLMLNQGIGMLLSFFCGPLLRRFSYRKVAVVGALLVSFGLMLASYATAFWMFLLSYSIINSMGIAGVMAAFTLAINSFFKEKRSRAVGAGMSITGLGGIATPLVMSALMTAFGWRYAILILSAICLHSLVAACLLRPAKWYLKNPPLITEEMVPLNRDNNVELVSESVSTMPKTNGVSVLPELEQFAHNDKRQSRSLSMRSLNTDPNNDKRNAISHTSHPDIRKQLTEPHLSESQYKWWESQEINLGSSINIFIEPDSRNNVEVKGKEENVAKKQTFFEKFVAFFDLTLLTDPIFVNILIGLSLGACVETCFSLVLPFILRDMMQFETDDIAKIHSIISFSDTLFRIVSPFIGEWCHKPPRVMYMVSLLLVIFIRTIMLFTSSFIGMIFVALALGVSKGIRTVYMNIVIPTHVPIERLPFASGIQMLINGISISIAGFMVGRTRESTGSYVIPVLGLNSVALIAIMLWSAEFLYFKIQSNNNDQKDSLEL